MFEIIEKRQLSSDVFYFKVQAKEIAHNRLAGQFVIVQTDAENGERIPLTIADANAKEGWIALVFQAVGATTIKLSRMKAGDALGALLGPLGEPSVIKTYDRPVVVVGGGIGVAPCYPIVQALKEAGNNVTVIIGARCKDLLIFADEMRAAADEVIIMTDDGSAGKKGLVTVPLEEKCKAEIKPAMIIAIGPPIMMKAASKTAETYNVPITVSLNTIMIDGTGMCGGCRVSVGGETKFVCVDGPDFDGRKVDWDNMMMRQGTFKKEEALAVHKCKLG